MPVPTKDKLIQIRLETELFDRFAALCDKKGYTVSAAIRWSMQASVDQYDKSVARKVMNEEWASKSYVVTPAQRASQASKVPVAPVVPVAIEEEPDDLVVPSQSRQQRRKAEREAKKNRDY